MAAISSATASSMDQSILLVTDHAPNWSAPIRTMEAVGYRVSIAAGIANGLYALESASFACVLVDLGEESARATELLDAVNQRGLSVAVIFISANWAAEAASRAMELGACACIESAFLAERLLQALDSALRGDRLARLQARAVLRMARSERLLHFVIENSPEIVFILDADGCLVLVNRRVEALLGHQSEELLGQPLREIVDAKSRDDLDEVLARALRCQGRQFSGEFLLTTAESSRNERCFEMTVIASGEADVGGAELELGSAVFGVARDVTDKKSAEMLMAFHSLHDPLTRLPNRTLFKDRVQAALARASRRSERLAVLFIDLDGFKAVNDTLGHEAGDELLKNVSKRLFDCIRGSDTIARFGGDEFTILLPDVEDEGGVIRVARKVLDTVMHPVSLRNGKQAQVGASIGIGLYPEHGRTVEQLLQSADLAMYFVKTRGKNDCQVFSETMRSASGDFCQAIHTQLAQAMEREEFQILYQPIVHLRRNIVAGVEALIRWNHPNHGLMVPGQFLFSQEGQRIIGELDHRTLAVATRRVAELRQAFYPDLRLTVNASVSMMQGQDFTRSLSEIMQHAQVDPHLLELDVTEGSLRQHGKDLEAGLSVLQRSGVRVAVERFGGDFDSLRLLQDLPLSTVKINAQELLAARNREHPKYCLMLAILAVTQQLGVTVIATAVETREQLRLLDELGCEFAQGHLLGRPLTDRQLMEFLMRVDYVGDLERSATS